MCVSAAAAAAAKAATAAEEWQPTCLSPSAKNAPTKDEWQTRGNSISALLRCLPISLLLEACGRPHKHGRVAKPASFCCCRQGDAKKRWRLEQRGGWASETSSTASQTTPPFFLTHTHLRIKHTYTWVPWHQPQSSVLMKSCLLNQWRGRGMRRRRW